MKKSHIVIFSTIMFFDYCGLFIILPILSPMILANDNIFDVHNLSFLTLGSLVTMFGLGQFFGSPILGALSDYYGRKPLIITALLFSSLSYFLSALSIVFGSLIGLFLSRFLTGVSSGNSAILFATVGDMSEVKERGRNMGYLTLGLALGGVIGPLLGGYLAQLPFSRAEQEGDLPFILMSLIFLALTPFVSFINNGNLQYIKKINFSSKVFLKLSIENVFYVFRAPQYNIKILFFAFFTFALSTEGLLVALPIVATTKFHANSIGLGWLFAIGGISSLISGFFVNSFLSKKYNSMKNVIICLTLLVIAYLMFLPAFSYNYILLPWVLMTSTCLLVWSHANAVILDHYSADKHGKIMGITQSLVSLATLLSPLLVGLFAHFDIIAAFGVSLIFGLISWSLFLSYKIKSQSYEVV